MFKLWPPSQFTAHLESGLDTAYVTSTIFFFKAPAKWIIKLILNSSNFLKFDPYDSWPSSGFVFGSSWQSVVIHLLYKQFMVGGTKSQLILTDIKLNLFRLWKSDLKQEHRVLHHLNYCLVSKATEPTEVVKLGFLGRNWYEAYLNLPNFFWSDSPPFSPLLHTILTT